MRRSIINKLKIGVAGAAGFVGRYLIEALIEKNYDVVGPVCETGDFLGKDRFMSAEEKNILAILDVGAYGMSMSSNYNSRPKVPEIIVDDNKCHLIKNRESFSDLINSEKLLP